MQQKITIIAAGILLAAVSCTSRHAPPLKPEFELAPDEVAQADATPTTPTPAVPAAPAPEAPAAVTPATQTGDVRSIQIPYYPPTLPGGPGQPMALSACVLCHTPRYITMQPPFPRKTWVAEVDKMRKTFGAPLTDEQAGQIVEYLVSIRGTGEPARQPAK
jgi:mono/diheme cytochrome c family protein